jgi:hypothetical protein
VIAGALRPVVVLMLVASGLFLVDGVLDGVYPGGPAWVGSDAFHGYGVETYVFAVLNLLVAILIASGSERTLVARIGLSAVFVIERSATAFILGPKELPSVAVHFLTAFIEAVILISALRVWRLGHGVESMSIDALLSLDSPVPAPADETEDVGHAADIAPRGGVLLAALTLALAGVLVADGIVSGFVPGGRAWGLVGDSSGWLVYLFAVVALMAAVRAVHGGRLALRILLVVALIFFIERAFSPLALRLTDPVALLLHALAAFVALALALTTVSVIRNPTSTTQHGVARAQTT